MFYVCWDSGSSRGALNNQSPWSVFQGPISAVTWSRFEDSVGVHRCKPVYQEEGSVMVGTLYQEIIKYKND